MQKRPETENITFYMLRWKQIAVGFGLILGGFIPAVLLYILLGHEESFLQIIQSLGPVNILLGGMVLSGLYFIASKRIPMIRFERHKFYYNEFVLRSHMRSELLFFFFPYLYRNLKSSSLYYQNIEHVKSHPQGILIKKKKTGMLIRNTMTLQTGVFAKTDRNEIQDLLLHYTKNSTN